MQAISLLSTDRHCISQAANYLDSKELLDLTCLTAANMIKGMAR